ncbi:MAG: hypothetical protein BM557_03145 [Flavobacterium sp. MedPE-SWcel]|uniref:hypothetical protein n=1 Tax=uncultured Flavobacterium sp. TaxID=165435 RepID=UPI000917CF71|nr:hypothetical protein [uncultured Flavobacterium sp.]OIQ21803.1 MAG: hypothetical protein BM557_03145 [Flavobacterium sp. MedPE-SWcel]
MKVNDNFIFSLKCLADLEQQKLAWNGKIPNCVSSFDEEVNTLYDCGFECYIEEIKKRDSQSELSRKLIELDELIENYDREGGFRDQILHDPEWVLITHKAQEILDLL